MGIDLLAHAEKKRAVKMIPKTIVFCFFNVRSMTPPWKAQKMKDQSLSHTTEHLRREMAESVQDIVC